MIRFISRRLGQGILTLFLVSVLVFFLVNLAPGGPSAMMSMEQTTEQRAAIEKQLGLDKPVAERYINWLKGAVTLDFGASLDSQQPVTALLKERFPNTLILAASTLVVTLLIGIPLGVLASVKRGSWLDRFSTATSTIGMAVPDFWLGILLIILLSVIFPVLPASGMATAGMGFSFIDLLQHLVLPVITMSVLMLPNIVRFTRTAMIDVLNMDYMRTARAKGLTFTKIFFRHALRSALVPITAIIGLMVPLLLGGSVVVESVFSWPGMGRLAVQAAVNRDYTVIMGVTMLVGAIVIVCNIIVDIIYSFLDPRIQYGK